MKFVIRFLKVVILFFPLLITGVVIFGTTALYEIIKPIRGILKFFKH
jgi:hypothetical protein